MDIRFGNELALQEIRLGVATLAPDDRQILAAGLTWRVAQKPTVDYKITLRLRDMSGADIVQRDDYPIGPLLPPTTWHPGDTKPGYRTLPLPAEGNYQLVVGAYDPTNGVAIPYTTADQSQGEVTEFFILAHLQIDADGVNFSANEPLQFQ